jgi:hypothetical protein
MKVLFVVIVSFLTLLQATDAQIVVADDVMRMVYAETDSDNQEKNTSPDSDDEEIVFIPVNCSPVFSIIQPEEIIYTYSAGLKSRVLLSLWHPPKLSFLN